MKVFAAQVDQPIGQKEHLLLITEFEVAFTAKTMQMRPGPQVPNFYRRQQPFSQAHVEAGVMAVGLHRGIALATTQERAIQTLRAHLEKQVQQTQKALAEAEARLRVAMYAPEQA